MFHKLKNVLKKKSREKTNGVSSQDLKKQSDQVTENVDKRRDVVIGPEGTPLTLADLPSPRTTRWVIRRKEEVVYAIEGGLLTFDDAQIRYGLSPKELRSWQHMVNNTLKPITISSVTGINPARVQSEMILNALEEDTKFKMNSAIRGWLISGVKYKAAQEYDLSDGPYDETQHEEEQAKYKSEYSLLRRKAEQIALSKELPRDTYLLTVDQLALYEELSATMKRLSREASKFHAKRLRLASKVQEINNVADSLETGTPEKEVWLKKLESLNAERSDNFKQHRQSVEAGDKAKTDFHQYESKLLDSLIEPSKIQVPDLTRKIAIEVFGDYEVSHMEKYYYEDFIKNSVKSSQSST